MVIEKGEDNSLKALYSLEEQKLLSIVYRFEWFTGDTGKEGVHSWLAVAPEQEARSFEELVGFANVLPRAAEAMLHAGKLSGDTVWIPTLQYYLDAVTITTTRKVSVSAALPLKLQDRLKRGVAREYETEESIPHRVEVVVYPSTQIAQAVANLSAPVIRERERKGLAFSVSTYDSDRPARDLSMYDKREYGGFDASIPAAVLGLSTT